MHSTRVNLCQQHRRLLCYRIYWNLIFLEYFVPLTHTIIIFNLSLKRNTLVPVVWVYASYVNRTHANSLVGCYATTTPTMLRRLTIEEINFRTIKHGFFLTHFPSVTSRKNQNNSLRSGINFSLTRTICSHSSKAVVVSSLLLLKVNWISKNDKNLLFHEYFVTLTHTIVMLNLSLKLNILLPPVWVLNFSLKLNILLPPVWVYASYGNRTHVNSLEGCYGTTTPTMLRMFTIEDMNLRTFKHGFFLTHFLNVTARKNQKNSLRSGVNFSLTRPICSHSSKAVVVSDLLVLKVNGNLKNDKNLLFHDILSL